MPNKSIELYEGDFGHTIRAYTWCDEVDTANTVKLKFKRPSDGTTAELSASYVSGDTTYYAVDATITDGWTTDKVGHWIGQVEATWTGSSRIMGEEFEMNIRSLPTT